MVLLVAPLLADLTQLALSRVREFSADLGAAELLGDPTPMIAALIRMESPGLSWFERLTGPPQSYQHIPTILRTHPETSERIARLRRLQGERHWPEENVMDMFHGRVRGGRGERHDAGRFWPFGT
jgi:heat shock protein HtpX